MLSPKGIQERVGLCYQLAWRWLVGKEGTLVHGVVFTDGQWINHAWVELEDVVYEPQSNNLFRKSVFYESLQAKAAQKYSLDEAMILAARTKNYGPWSSAERELAQAALRRKAK